MPTRLLHVAVHADDQRLGVRVPVEGVSHGLSVQRLRQWDAPDPRVVPDVLAGPGVSGQGIHQLHQARGVEHSGHDARHLGAEHDVTPRVLRVRLRVLDPRQPVMVLKPLAVLVVVGLGTALVAFHVEDAAKLEQAADDFPTPRVLLGHVHRGAHRIQRVEPAGQPRARPGAVERRAAAGHRRVVVLLRSEPFQRRHVPFG
mmetsp:Transcript_4421/g.19814  ORF Transcript_4421/g.19814 Transcript_4421/m.19814 type:complete len:201 (+) Transcript_4421:549-1151(+)